MSIKIIFLPKCVVIHVDVYYNHDAIIQYNIEKTTVHKKAHNATDPVEFHVHRVAFLGIVFSDELFLVDDLCDCVQYVHS